MSRVDGVRGSDERDSPGRADGIGEREGAGGIDDRDRPDGGSPSRDERHQRDEAQPGTARPVASGTAQPAPSVKAETFTPRPAGTTALLPSGPARASAGAGAATASSPATGRPRRVWGLTLLRSELVITFRRWRTLALLGVLAAVPILVGIAVKLETNDGGTAGPGGGGGGGPAFIAQVTNNGLFLVFTALAATLPFFLPMSVGVVAGDSIAGEAHAGTLRYLLVAPAGRGRLLLVKYATVMTFCLVATLVVATFALATGAVLFPLGEVTTISGTTISFAGGLLRALLIALLVAASLLGVAALGLFVSTLTSSGIAAMATTVGLLITMQILDQIPQLHALHPYFFSHYWLSFADVMRDPVYWNDVVKNLGLQGLYALVFGSAAWARFTTKDITT